MIPPLTDAQLASELARCEYCEEKACRDGCPCHCSPADFIMAARGLCEGDFQRAAAEILTRNPLGGVCGAVCPDRFCQARCARATFDRPVEIPAIQATLVAKAMALGASPRLTPAVRNGMKVAVVGAGPAGVAAAAYLAQRGYEVTIFEKERRLGGACNLIPAHRLDREILNNDLDWTLRSTRVAVEVGVAVDEPSVFLDLGYRAVVVAVGLGSPLALGVPGEEHALSGLDYLKDPAAYPMPGKVVVIGGGATAVDCAVTARRRGAAHVEMLALEAWAEMPLTTRERAEILAHGIEVSGRSKVVAIDRHGIRTVRVALQDGASFDFRAIVEVAGTEERRDHVVQVIVAIGARSVLKKIEHPAVFFAGDCEHGPSTVVEAVASGKNAAARVDALLANAPAPALDAARPRKSFAIIPGHRRLPVPLTTDFFGRTLPSPLLLSASPATDGYEPMRKALAAGWAGGVMKTAFDGIPVHIPADYFIAFDSKTWGNCDNVSGHALDRVCREINRLVKEFPDRLIAASTGGPVTGDPDNDRRGWQSNTKKLESAGAMCIEYSLSCPQGGDGTEGAIVSQNARLTARIVDDVLQVSDPSIPKLFKLTAAVTSIEVILRAIREVLARYPQKKAGVTLANTFPVLGFRRWSKRGRWDEAIVYGMSGSGVAPISYLTLAGAASIGIPISGNGGAMDAKQAADFLALGCNTVQMCTAPMKYGYGYVDELHSGLSHLLAERGLSSIQELIGCALPKPVTDFMELTPRKRISSVAKERCKSCGNCSRCSYGAISLDPERHPAIDPERCIGCSLCTQSCFAGALRMRERTPEERAALREA